ncbi:FAD-dependent oxidoreductase [Snodgrassella alvi]|uniref:FAD-dependent oxidoreductase n=1 Tax=Snodgrassella alvi TaxID=1196083 RepID=UPI003515AD0B
MKISRRRFLSNVLGASMVGLSSYEAWRYFVPGQPPISVDFPGKAVGHAIRDAQRQPPANIPTRHVNTVIVGSGAAGLSAAWQLSRQGMHDYILLDGAERNGNNRGEHQFGVDYPTGAHYLPLPSPESEHIRELLGDLQLYQHGVYDERSLLQVPNERLFYQQHWQNELLPQRDADSQRFFRFIHQLSSQRGVDGKRIFTIPLNLASNDNEWRRLERITFANWLEQQGYHSPTLLWYLDYCCRDDYGQGIGQICAWAGLHYFCARGTEQNEHGTVLTWPHGLHELSQRIRAFCRLQAIENITETDQPFTQPRSFRAYAVSIEEEAQGVRLLICTAQQQYFWLQARHAICAMPLYIAAHVVQNIQRYGFQPQTHMPQYAPWIVANFLLRGMPPEKSGSALAWDNIVYQGNGLGYVVATHQQIRQGPPPFTSFTAYTALNHDSPTNIRHWMLSASPEEIYQCAAKELEEIYGIVLRKRMVQARISLRGHAMAVPQPGYLTNAGLMALRSYQGRLQFAHSDLSGYSIFEEACYWGKRAAEQILAQQ